MGRVASLVLLPDRNSVLAVNQKLTVNSQDLQVSSARFRKCLVFGIL